MRSWLGLAGLIGLLAVTAGARATDLNGAWKGVLDYQGTSVPLTFNLTVGDAAVTGTVEGLPTSPADIHEGKLDGDTMTFWVNTDYQGQTYKLQCTGKLSAAGDEIAFAIGTEDKSWSAPLTVTKSAAPATPVVPTMPAADVTGAWKGAFDFNGGSMPLTIHLTSTAGAVTGTVEGLPTTPADIHDGKVDGDKVTFWVNTDYQGQTYKLTYTGKIAAGQIVFTFGTEDGSFSAQLTVTKGT